MGASFVFRLEWLQGVALAVLLRAKLALSCLLSRSLLTTFSSQPLLVGFAAATGLWFAGCQVLLLPLLLVGLLHVPLAGWASD